MERPIRTWHLRESSRLVLTASPRRSIPGRSIIDNLYEVPEEELLARHIGILPGTLAEALDAFAEDSILQDALGTNYAKEYLKVKQDEWWQHSRNVSRWERDYYLATY